MTKKTLLDLRKKGWGFLNRDLPVLSNFSPFSLIYWNKNQDQNLQMIVYKQKYNLK